MDFHFHSRGEGRKGMEEVDGGNEDGWKRGWTCAYTTACDNGGFEPTSHAFVQGGPPTTAGSVAVS